MPLHIVILAAGQGTRMYSQTPKVLHPIGGQSMLKRVVETALALSPERIHVMIGHAAQQIQQALSDEPVHWIVQAQQLGTGHAVMQALPFIPDECSVLVLSADVPLIKAKTLSNFIQSVEQTSSSKTPLGLLLATVPDPTGLGRMIRNHQQQILAIVEEKDATEEQRKIHEIYSGICCAQAADLKRWLPKITRHNAQEEYYLTEMIALAVAEAHPVTSLQAQHAYEVQGVNNRLQLQQLERIWQKQLAEKLLLKGVSLADVNRIDIRGELVCGLDVQIDVNAVFSGNVTIGNGCTIGPNCILNNVVLEDHCTILANSVLDGCHIGEHSQIGPFARIRPGTKLSAHCKLGNFVEAKNAVFGEGSKASHLSYLGDVSIGQQVNIGAGTITCNFDGVNKHQTVIEDGAFIGSDTQLVAPVTIGQNATIGAGSTIRRNAPPGELTLTKSKQTTVYGWSRAKK